MERYRLLDLYSLLQFKNALSLNSAMLMGLSSSSPEFNNVKEFIANVVYGYFFGDLVAYEGVDEYDVKTILLESLNYDISVNFPYWYRKYVYVKKLLTDADFSLLQTSKMTSSSSDTTDSASGTLQKTATTPTGVSATGSTDNIDISITSTSSGNDADVETTGFTDKYTNAQQKFANATKVIGARSGEILREGSIDELLNVLEKLPSSFADEINRKLQKHFIFDYDGVKEGIYGGAHGA